MMKQVELVITNEWNKFNHLFKRKEVPAKTLLLREGEVSKIGYFVESGSLRSWFNHNGRDITFQFFMEGTGVSSIESFTTAQPTLFNIETIEASAVLTITKKDFLYIQASSPLLKEYINKQIITRIFHYQKLFLSRIKDAPLQRYLDLINETPEIIQRVPQHYIASYLGITTMHLSRIKSKIATGNF